MNSHSARLLMRALLPVLLATLLLLTIDIELQPSKQRVEIASALDDQKVSEGDQHGYPRTFVINKLRDISNYWRYDWVVGFPWQDVRNYHRLNPTGIALTYTRQDVPPYNLTKMNTDSNPTDPWDCSNASLAFQAVSNSYFPGEQERYTLENWKGGADTLTDGAAANVGYMRPWDRSTDTYGTEDCAPYEVTHTWNLASAGQLVGQLQVYMAKKLGLYAHGWDGVWSDNGFHRYSTAWTDGLYKAFSFMSQSLPGKTVGANGAWIEWYRSGWMGSVPKGWWQMSNANLIEGFEARFGHINNDSVATFIDWNLSGIKYPDPYGRKRYAAFWDAFAENATGHDSLTPSTLQRVRWGLTLAMMAGVYYAPPNSNQWYDEFWGGSLIMKRGYLGVALGPAVRGANRVWRRDFQKGIALNNSTSSSRTVSLGGTFRRLRGTQAPVVNNGKSVTSIALGSKDGIILLRSRRPASRIVPSTQTARRGRPSRS